MYTIWIVSASTFTTFSPIFFQGGVILVSHDERLISAICNELWVCSKGKVYRMEGGLEEYRELVEKEMVI